MHGSPPSVVADPAEHRNPQAVRSRNGNAEALRKHVEMLTLQAISATFGVGSGQDAPRRRSTRRSPTRRVTPSASSRSSSPCAMRRLAPSSSRSSASAIDSCTVAVRDDELAHLGEALAGVGEVAAEADDPRAPLERGAERRELALGQPRGQAERRQVGRREPSRGERGEQGVGLLGVRAAAIGACAHEQHVRAVALAARRRRRGGRAGHRRPGQAERPHARAARARAGARPRAARAASAPSPAARRSAPASSQVDSAPGSCRTSPEATSSPSDALWPPRSRAAPAARSAPGRAATLRPGAPRARASGRRHSPAAAGGRGPSRSRRAAPAPGRARRRRRSWPGERWCGRSRDRLAPRSRAHAGAAGRGPPSPPAARSARAARRVRRCTPCPRAPVRARRARPPGRSASARNSTSRR